MIKGVSKHPLVPLWYLIVLSDLEQNIIYSLADNRLEYTLCVLGQLLECGFHTGMKFCWCGQWQDSMVWRAQVGPWVEQRPWQLAVDRIKFSVQTWARDCPSGKGMEAAEFEVTISKNGGTNSNPPPPPPVVREGWHQTSDSRLPGRDY